MCKMTPKIYLIAKILQSELVNFRWVAMGLNQHHHPCNGYVPLGKTIIWANDDPDLCHHIASLGQNELIQPLVRTRIPLITAWLYQTCLFLLDTHCVLFLPQNILIIVGRTKLFSFFKTCFLKWLNRPIYHPCYRYKGHSNLRLYHV